MSMKNKHPDAIALDRLGFLRVKAHFNITRQAFAYWRDKGVPNIHRKTLVMLGGVHGIQVPELAQERNPS